MTDDAPTPSWQQIQNEFYDDPSKHSHLTFDARSLYARRLVDALAHEAAINASHTVLEVGAGAGRFTLHLVKKCAGVVALDTSQPLLDALVQVTPPGVHVEPLCASVFDLDEVIPDRQFDRICGFFILHHLPSHRELFTTLKHKLAPGGKLCFLEPNRANPLFLAQVMISREMTWKAEKGMFTFSASRTVRLLKEFGFANVTLHRCGFFPPQILDRFTAALSVEQTLESFAPLRRILPFVVITADRS